MDPLPVRRSSSPSVSTSALAAQLSSLLETEEKKEATRGFMSCLFSRSRLTHIVYEISGLVVFSIIGREGTVCVEGMRTDSSDHACETREGNA